MVSKENMILKIVIGAISLLSSAIAAFNCSLIQAIILITVITMACFVIIFCRNIVKWLTRGNIKAKRKNAIIISNEISADIHHLNRQDNISNTQFSVAMNSFCDKLKNLFDENSKVDYSVSIKVPTNGHSFKQCECQLRNLCRDKLHEQRDTNRYNQTPHTIIGNTAFSIVISNLISNTDEFAYINNDIQNTKY